MIKSGVVFAITLGMLGVSAPALADLDLQNGSVIHFTDGSTLSTATGMGADGAQGPKVIRVRKATQGQMAHRAPKVIRVRKATQGQMVRTQTYRPATEAPATPSTEPIRLSEAAIQISSLMTMAPSVVD